MTGVITSRGRVVGLRRAGLGVCAALTVMAAVAPAALAALAAGGTGTWVNPAMAASATSDSSATSGTTTKKADATSGVAAKPAAPDVMTSLAVTPAALRVAGPASIGRIQSVPSKPTGVTAVPGDRRIEVGWNIQGDAIDYRVWVTAVQGAAFPGDGFCDPGDDLLPATTPCIIFNLTNGTPYYAYVQARYVPDLSQAVAANGGATVTPSAPVGPASGVSSTTGTGQITVNWNPAAGGQGSIRYHAWASALANDAYPGQHKCPDSTAITGTSCTITGLTGGTGYHVYVQAVDAYSTSAATSAPGDPLVVPPAAPHLPAAPGAPRSIGVLPGTDELVVSWQAPTDAGGGITGYIVDVANGGSVVGHCGPTPGLTCTVSGLTAGAAYHVTVTALGAVDGVESGPAAATGTFTPVAAVADVPTPATVPTPDGTLQADKTSMTSGDVVTVSGTGFAADTLIEITMYSTPRVLKTVMTDKAGAFSTTVLLPAGVTGAHTLVAGGMNPDGSYRYLTVPITVAPATSGSGGLAVTGAAVQRLALMATLIALFGVGLLVITRRRKTRL